MHIRSISVAVLALAASACATIPEAQRVQMPLEIVREEGQHPRLAAAVLRAGSYADDSPFSFSIHFDEGIALGEPRSVGWTANFRDYCSDQPSWLQSVLIGPSGQVWRGFRVFVPPGPDRSQYWSSGATGATGVVAQATPGLLEAIASGGRFTLALENEEGLRWEKAVIDTLTPAERGALFRTNQIALRDADPAIPIKEARMLIAVERAPFSPPASPRPCPRPVPLD